MILSSSGAQRSICFAIVTSPLSGSGDPIHARGGTAVQRLLLRRRRAGGNALEGVPQLGISARLLVRREVALEHATIDAERFDAGLDILTPRRREILG